MPAGFFIQDQSAYDQGNDDQKDCGYNDGSDIRLYPEKHMMSAPFLYHAPLFMQRGMAVFSFMPLSRSL